MKRNLLLFCLSLFATCTFAQLNMSYVGNIQYSQELSDVWGYAAPDGTEYAIVGVFNGVSVVSLADPANPLEVAFIPGPNSTWRDIKTWGDYAYVTNETSGGLLVIDLTNLPTEVTSFNWQPSLPGLGTLSRCHNLWIDELGTAYLCGCNVNSGGLLFVDVATQPGNPMFSGAGDPTYSHDVYVRDNIAYSAEINIGEFGVYDVTDKANPLFLAGQATPFQASHNLWLSDDSNILFTTDETGDAPVTSYDVSDLTDIKELDQFRPLETLGEGVIPHNVHVWDDFLIISYYTDGCILVDAARPQNLIEVGNFDTFFPASTGFSGAWGAYPFLPSGLVLVSDIESGLYILEPNYVRACYLEGKVTDAVSGAAIFGAQVDLQGILAFGETDLSGNFATGTPISGSYDVLVSKAGFFPKTASVELANGEVTELNVELEPLPSFAISGIVKDLETGEGVEGAQVKISNADFSYDLITGVNGQFNVSSFFEGTYDVIAGKWGHTTGFLSASQIDEANNVVEIEIEKGIEDVFSLDLGWAISGNAFQGQFELGNPIGINPGLPYLIQPEDDVDEDPGNSCYLTGNTADVQGGVQIAGFTEMTSPTFDLSSMNEPKLSFYYWVFTANIENPVPTAGNDKLVVTLSNGMESKVVAEFSYNDLTVAPAWTYYEIAVADTIEPTANMQVSFEIGDNDPNFVDVAEAAVDYFRAWDADPVSSTRDAFDENITMDIFPNPSADVFMVKYSLEANIGEAKLLVFNVLGQLVDTQILTNNDGKATLGQALGKGIYFVRIEQDGKSSRSTRLAKQ